MIVVCAGERPAHESSSIGSNLGVQEPRSRSQNLHAAFIGASGSAINRLAMKVPMQQIFRTRKPHRRKPVSVNGILRGAYRKFTTDKHARQAVHVLLR